MTEPHPQRLKIATGARLVAATLALAALIYTVTHFMVKAKSEVFVEMIEQLEERLDVLEDKSPKKNKT